MLYPLEGNRLIDSPFHAARFVSLIPFQRKEAPGGQKVEIWHSIHSFLARVSFVSSLIFLKGCGDCEDHSLLLCCLLLGFGLDAYVCVGTGGEGPHTWVLTRIYKTNGVRIITFWESLTGQRFEIGSSFPN
jgi:centrosomal protein CEP76